MPVAILVLQVLLSSLLESSFRKSHSLTTNKGRQLKRPKQDQSTNEELLRLTMSKDIAQHGTLFVSVSGSCKVSTDRQFLPLICKRRRRHLLSPIVIFSVLGWGVGRCELVDTFHKLRSAVLTKTRREPTHR